MRRAPDDARGSDGARGGVDLIHASLSSAEKVDIARARRTRARYLRPSGSRLLSSWGAPSWQFFRGVQILHLCLHGVRVHTVALAVAAVVRGYSGKSDCQNAAFGSARVQAERRSPDVPPAQDPRWWHQGPCY